MFWIPMAVGAGLGALTNKNPLKGAAMGAGLGAATGGLGGLMGGAGAASGALSGAAATAAAPAATTAAGAITGATTGSGLGLSAAGMGAPSLASMGGGTGLLAGQGAAAAGTGGAQGLTAGGVGAPGASSGLGGLLSQENLKTAGNVAGLAQAAGVFNDPPAPQAQSAGIPGRGGVDFSGLLSASRANDMSGAQRLAQQRAQRMGRG